VIIHIYTSQLIVFKGTGDIRLYLQKEIKRTPFWNITAEQEQCVV